jgi:hypothetical protein
MNGGYSQQARVLIKVAQSQGYNPNRRSSSDSVWPLRRADGSKFYEKPVKEGAQS